MSREGLGAAIAAPLAAVLTAVALTVAWRYPVAHRQTAPCNPFPVNFAPYAGQGHTYKGIEEIAGKCVPATYEGYANGDTSFDSQLVPCLVQTDTPGFHRVLIAGDALACPTIKRQWDSTEVVTHGGHWYGPTGSP